MARPLFCTKESGRLTLMTDLIQLGIDFNHAIEAYRTPLLTSIFKFFAFLGSSKGYMILLPLVFWVFSTKLGLRLMYGVLCSALTNLILKSLFAIERPFVQSSLVTPLENPGNFSFPSGHAQTAGFFAVFIALSVKSRSVQILALASASLIGLSRIYLGVHFFFDVITGWTVGAVLAGLWVRNSKFIDSLEHPRGYAKRIIMLTTVTVLLPMWMPNSGLLTLFGSLWGMLLFSGRRTADLKHLDHIGFSLAKIFCVLIGYAICFSIVTASKSLPSNAIWSFTSYFFITFWVSFLLPRFFRKIRSARKT
ncbi:hypothetical protein COB52_05270 [Candidatus Kaiserbacteria bacterium]|nr:MAG: hypothetical protein COB52_05270 [Candidatus Kaiserbacteria bacterium]